MPLPFPAPMLSAAFHRLLPWIRSQFPQVDRLRDGEPRIYLDNAAGTLVPSTVADAMQQAALWANPQPDRGWPPGPATRAAHRRCRELLYDFLHAPEEGRVYLSESTTASLYKLREALEPTWHLGTNLVVTDCDHFANISPWEWRAMWDVRRVPMLPDGHLHLERLAHWLDEDTRVVAMTQASNGLGTLQRLEEAIALVRERAPRAWVVIDAVHGAPHAPIDLIDLGADALAFSTYKLFGPHAGVLWLSPTLAETVQPYRVLPHQDPETLMEWGTLNNAGVAAITAALEYLLRLGEKLEPQAVGQFTQYQRRQRHFKLALEGIRAYEQELSQHLLPRLTAVPGLRLYGITDPARTAERVPTFAFDHEERTLEELERGLWERGRLQVAVGNHYAASVTRGLGKAGVARASFSHYNSLEEAEALAAALTP